jgi:hypothetical protein
MLPFAQSVVFTPPFYSGWRVRPHGYGTTVDRPGYSGYNGVFLPHIFPGYKKQLALDLAWELTRNLRKLLCHIECNRVKGLADAPRSGDGPQTTGTRPSAAVIIEANQYQCDARDWGLLGPKAIEEKKREREQKN